MSVGKITRAHGVRGEVRVEVRTDRPDERFAAGGVLWIGGPEVADKPAASGRARSGQLVQLSLTVASSRWHGEQLLVRFHDVPDRTAAETLRGMSLQADVPDDDELSGPDEYADHRLVGLHVVTTNGDDVGRVTGVVHGPGQDLLAVERAQSAKKGEIAGAAETAEVLVPFVTEIVPEVDLDGGRIVVDPPPGLLELGVSGAGDAAAPGEPRT